MLARSELRSGMAASGQGSRRASLSGKKDSKNVGMVNSVIDAYARQGRIDDAYRIFQAMERRTVASWNCIIQGFVRCSQPELALELFSRLQCDGLASNSRTFVAALKACSCLVAKPDGSRAASLKKGKDLHSQLQIHGLLDNFVATALVDLYGKCGRMKDALAAFEAVELDRRDTVLWSAIISACSQNQEEELALELFELMVEESGRGVKPNAWTLVAVLAACTNLGLTDKGWAIYSQHSHRDSAILFSVFVSNGLIDMFAKAGNLDESRRVFDKMAQRDSVSWNVMILAYVRSGHGELALELFSRMITDHKLLRFDSRTFVAVLQACTEMAGREEPQLVDGRYMKLVSLERALAIHSWLSRETSLHKDLHLGNSLMNLYARCGCVDDATRVFDEISRDVVSWNILIEAHIQNGSNSIALREFSMMNLQGCSPDFQTFAAALKACGSMGALEAGQKIHRQLEDAGAERCPAVANSLISFYGKCGNMVEARRVFDKLKEGKDLVSWSALISGYSHQGNSNEVFELFERMQEFIKPDAVTFSSVLSVCCYAGLVDKGMEFFHAMSSDYGLDPSIEHVMSVVDLLGRANRLEDALAVVTSSETWSNDSRTWMALLGACFKWRNACIGKIVFEALSTFKDETGTAYALLANINSNATMA